MTTNKVAGAAKKPPIKKMPVQARRVAKPPVKSIIKAMPEPAAKKPKKEHKVKVVRDSFTMPQSEYQKIAEIKAACLKSKMHVKKSEILRAGLKILTEMNFAQLKRVMDSLEKIKTGRPKKH